MTRQSILFSSLLLCLLACACTSAWAVEVVVVKGLDIRPYNEALEGFKAFCGCDVHELALTENGHDGIARKVLDRNPAGVLAIGIDALEHVLSLKDIPVFYAMVPGPQVVPPGHSNVSGVSMYVPPHRSLEAIREVFPDAARIGVVYSLRGSEQFMKDAAPAAQSLGLKLVTRQVSRPADVPAAIDSLKDRIDVLWMVPDATVINAESVKYMLLFSFQNRVPVFTFSKKYAEMGAVAALNVFPYDMGVQAGEIARGVLQDRRSAPVRTDVRKTALAINAKVARKLGLKLREELLRRVEDVSR